jgi:hypothetical protein
VNAKAETRAQKIFRAYRHGKYFFVRNPMPFEFAHVASTIPRGLWSISQYKAAASKIKEGFFRENLVVVVGIAKAGTKSLVRSLRILQDSYRPLHGAIPIWRPMMQKARYFDAHGTADLQLEIVIDALDGGVLHTHSSPNYRSLMVLGHLECKYVILFRHPLSRMAPVYCSCLQNFAALDSELDIPKYFLDAIFPIRSEIFDGNSNPDEVIRYMIEGGYLEATLLWMAMWLEICDPEKSMVIRYEDILEEYDNVLSALSMFAFDANPDEDILRECKVSFDSEKRSTSFIYPRGWPGDKTAANNYISRENRKLYSSVVSRFVESNSIGKKLLEIYPDLIEPNI